MLQILAITGPIYIAIGIGFVATRSSLFAKLDLRVLGKFVIHIALPALLLMRVIPLLLALAESGRSDAGHAWQVLRQTLARLVRNPMILALAAGSRDACASNVALGASSSAGMTRCVAMAVAPSTPQRMVLLINGLLCGG